MESKMWTGDDLLQMKAKGIKKEQVEKQLKEFEKGIAFENLKAPASIGSGIIKLEENKLQSWMNRFEKSSVKKMKFIPASGAATRMFKNLFFFLDEFDSQKENLQEFIARTEKNELTKFFQQLESLPFYKEVMNFQQLEKETVLDQLAVSFVQNLLDEDKLGYGSYPKGLVPFHKYEDEILTAFEIHFLEGMNYSQNDDVAHLHFTVAKKHLEKFKKAQTQIEKKYPKNDFCVAYSYQQENTDTLASTRDNQPFREKNGSLLFRPGGHGALIENLNQVEADVVFIKNIDNVCVHEYLNEIVEYKKVLGGILLEIQEQVFQVLKKIDAENPEALTEANEMLSSCFHSEEKIKSFTEAKKLLNRPIRVCGMVKNEGAPGGGPFWVLDHQGKASLQIVESAQIDHTNQSQQDIAAKATHFNPVDIVCGIKDYQGEKFNLLDFVDASKGFISEKSKDGRALKALELPGLWNGAMAHWNTIFVEVPLVTFNPVKTVVDLLKPSHQPQI
ncbi:DUF4301 family protein [Mesonia ostreae]|uniref:DUF4301 family protein n=1 Tax=Mesonia ostreae TaxID=861110 RepID=A0ABU2KKR6_9FLAO|nr:DUF4301 family protein [Mesonia ostreae]MDT0295253.1 DUF4301 family protein [Mesonia ostreae]